MYIINTETTDKVWIGKNSMSSKILIGILSPSGQIWSGEEIYRNNVSNDDYIKKVWQIATLLSKVWKDIDPMNGKFALDACISAIRADKLPLDDDRVEKLAEYVLHLGPKIRESLETPMQQEYINAYKKHFEAE